MPCAACLPPRRQPSASRRSTASEDSHLRPCAASVRKIASMTSPLRSLVACGTKLWLDSVDPTEIARNRALGATGATSNPIIIADLVKTGQFDDDLKKLFAQG